MTLSKKEAEDLIGLYWSYDNGMSMSAKEVVRMFDLEDMIDDDQYLKIQRIRYGSKEKL